jgi:ATP-dependent Lhr-like helicase
VFDLPALREVLTQLRSRAVRVVTVDTPKASPFAQSLLFNWIAAYMYEGDAPLAERRAAALALDRDLLRDLLGAEELRELLDPGVLADLELELQGLSDGRRARSADELHDVLRKVGDLAAAEADLRCDGGSASAWLAELVRDRRAVELSVAGDQRFIAAEDAARYRDALGCSLPLGLPRAFTEPVPHPLESLVARYAQTHAPFVGDDVVRRLGVPAPRITGVLLALEAEDRVVRGEFRPGGTGREWCDVDVLRQLRRRSLAALRREVEPVDPEAYARFVTQWHGIPGERRGLEALVEALALVQGTALVASSIETDVLPLRVRGYRSADLDELCANGEIIWVGAGAIGSNDGRVRLYFADQLPLLAPAIEPADAPVGAVHDAIRSLLTERGASFWPQLRAAAPSATEAELGAALWDLVWAVEVTNDTLAPLRSVLLGAKVGGGASRAPARGRPRPGRLTRIGPPTGAGRWSLVAPLLRPVPSSTAAAHAAALQMLERYGVVTREAVLAEGLVGGFSGVYGLLKVLEERGQTRRGYFVAGLGAAQFAVPGAVDRLRNVRDAVDVELHPDAVPAPLVLAATDPAQPYGTVLPWPESAGRPARSAGALVVLWQGVPLAWFDRRSHHLVTFPATATTAVWATALAGLVTEARARSIEVRKVDGQPLDPASPIGTALSGAGFVLSYRGMVRRS